MKRTLASLLCALVILVGWGMFPEKAHAYCVYNNSSSETISVLQLPVSPRSFKKVLGPNSNACCNWAEPTCVSSPGRYSTTPFAIFAGSQNLSALTAGAVIGQVVNPLLAKILDGFTGGIPVASSAVDLVNQAIEPLYQQGALGSVVTYNGGIVDFQNRNRMYGCWQGSCRGQDINYDGSRGPKYNRASVESDDKVLRDSDDTPLIDSDGKSLKDAA